MIGQATATSPRSARDRMRSDNRSVNEVVNLDAPRFFVQMVWDKLDVDTEAIPNKYLLRGEITPCRSFPQKSNIFEIPEGARMKHLDAVDIASGDNRVVWGFYMKHAAHEADRLRDLENSSSQTQKSGLVEIESLSGIRAELYDRFDFNKIFYPDGLENLPRTNKEFIAYLKNRVSELKTADTPEDLRTVLPQLGAELIAAAEKGAQIQDARVELTHRFMMLSPSDTSGLWKRDYDPVDLEMLERTAKPRVNQAQETTAEALHLLAKDRVGNGHQDDAFAAMIKAQQDQNDILRQQMEIQSKQNDQQNQLIRMLLADRQGNGKSPVPTDRKPEAPNLGTKK